VLVSESRVSCITRMSKGSSALAVRRVARLAFNPRMFHYRIRKGEDVEGAVVLSICGEC